VSTSRVSASYTEAPIKRTTKLIAFNCKYEDRYLLNLQNSIKPASIDISKVTSKGSFNVEMSLWKNSHFEKDIKGQYSSNPIIKMGEKVCVKLELDEQMKDIRDDLVLTATECWSSSKSNPKEHEKHQMITKKCKSDTDYSTDIKENGQSSTVKFCVTIYQWEPSQDKFYLQCKVAVCDDKIMFNGHSQCICPPKTYQTNNWFYPNYYEAQLDYNENLLRDFYRYGEFSLYGEGNDNFGEADNNYGLFYYDYMEPYVYPDDASASSRRRRSTSEHEESIRKKRYEFKGTFEKDEKGQLILPKGVKRDKESDLIPVGYGPILMDVKKGQGQAQLLSPESENSDDSLDKGVDVPWYKSAEKVNSLVVTIIGVILILSLSALEVVFSVYKRYTEKSEAKNRVLGEDHDRIKAFCDEVLNDPQVITASRECSVNNKKMQLAIRNSLSGSVVRK